MMDIRRFDGSSVYCRKEGLKKALCRPGMQAWYQNGSGPRQTVFAVRLGKESFWVDRETLTKLKRGRLTVGLVFSSRKGFNVVESVQNAVGYQQLKDGGRVRVVYTDGRWVSERRLGLAFYEGCSFVLPVVDQTAE